MTFFGYDGADIPRCGNSPRSRALSAPVSRSAARSASSRAHSCGRHRLVRSALAALLLGCSASVLPGVVLAQELDDLFVQGIELTEDNVEMREDSGQVSVGVTLSLEPAMNRTVMMTNSDPGAVTVSPGSLTFTPMNWNMAQFFYITPVQDDDTTDESVTLTLSSTGLTSKTVTVEVTDDDAQSIQSEDRVEMGEEESQVSVGVTLSAEPSSNRTVMLTNSDPGAVTVSPGSLTFTPETWNVEQFFSITPVQDDDATDESVTLTLGGTGLTSKTVTVEVTDDDTQSIQSADSVEMREDSGQVSIGVTLSARPNDVRAVAVVSGDKGVVTVSPRELEFTPETWNTEQFFYITPVQDDDTNDETVRLTLSSTGLDSKTVTVEVTDDDAQRIQSADRVEMGEEESRASVGVTLSAEPSSNRTVMLTNSDPEAVTVVSPGSLTFTPRNWDMEQFFYITPVQDDDTNDETVTLTLGGTGLTSKTVTVVVTDDDTQSIQSADSVEMREDSGQVSIGVTLSARPNDVRAVAVVSGDKGVVTVSPRELEFTPETWNVEQFFYITPVQDDDTNDESVTLTLSSTGLTSKTVTVKVRDDDTPPPDDDPEPVPAPALPLLGQLLLAGGLLRLGVMRLSRRGGAGT